MGYSLLDKFRGAWLGSIIAQQLATQNQEESLTKRNLTFFNDAKQQWFLWSTKEIAFTIQEQCQVLDIGEKKAINSVSQDNLNIEPIIGYIPLSILPIILYYHDYWDNLSNSIGQQGQSLQKSQAEIDNILIWCYVVRLALRGELIDRSALATRDHNLTNRVVMGTGLKQQSSILWLKKVEIFCLKGFSSMQLLKELSPMASLEIPLSLFCFLNNPEDFYLTVQQALSLEKKASNVTALSSVLSGAYNGLQGIPVNWRNLCQDREFYRQILRETEEMINQWLGSDFSVKTKTVSSVINAPKTLQCRSNLKIISQQEYESL